LRGIYERMGRKPEALEAAKAALETNPRHPRYLLNVVLLTEEAGGRKVLEALLKGIIARDPGNAEARNQLAALKSQLADERQRATGEGRTGERIPVLAMHQADGLVSGTNQVSSGVLRPLFQIIKVAPQATTASSCMVMEVEDSRFGEEGVMFMADCGVIPDPTVDELSDIAVDTARLAKDGGIAAGVIAGSQHGIAAGHRASGQGKWKNNGLTRAGRRAQATAITQTAIEFERGVVQTQCAAWTGVDASAAGGGLDGGVHAALAIECRQRVVACLECGHTRYCANTQVSTFLRKLPMAFGSTRRLLNWS
jgi:hypothetical protein